MAKDVKCKVNTCKFYGPGDYCEAKAIKICAETKSCGCSADTNCKTFQPK